MVYPEINLQSGVPLYQQLKRSFQRMAALGLIQPHEQLQSVIFCGQFNTCPSVPLPTPAFALV
ncbi:MAG TPA: hypothetical protein VFD14_02865 [Clostridia bacterium]|nr:hypothetical protein [Clostridia bacterium]